jgi:hypothetical protein
MMQFKAQMYEIKSGRQVNIRYPLSSRTMASSLV